MTTNRAMMAEDQPAVLSLSASTEFSEQGIVSRTLLSTPGLRVTLFGFAEGQELTEHATGSRALVQVISGRSIWVVAGCRMELAAGEVLHLPPGTPHAVRAPEAFSMLLTLVKERGQTADA